MNTQHDLEGFSQVNTQHDLEGFSQVNTQHDYVSNLRGKNE